MPLRADSNELVPGAAFDGSGEVSELHDPPERVSMNGVYWLLVFR
jgi:hypothetical protein